MRRALKWIFVLLIIVVIGLGAGLSWAHVAIRRERSPLPAPESLFGSGGGGPTRVSVVNTASQIMPRSAVLDVARDPTSDAAYVMSHPSFVLEWADGKMLLIDAGMSRAAAASGSSPFRTGC
jgi:hypothetical protein